MAYDRRHRRKLSGRYLLSFLIALSLQSAAMLRLCQAQNPEENAIDVDTNLARSLILQHRSDHLLGNAIDLYADDSKPTNIRYYPLFYVFPDWSKANEDLKAVCSKPEDASKTTEILVDVEVTSNRVQQEIIQGESPPTALPPWPAFTRSNIVLYPYNWIEIYVGASSFPEPRLVYQWPPPAIASLQTRISIAPPPIRIPVKGTCLEIRHILDFYDISGRLIAATRQFKVQSITAAMKDFTNSQEFDDMLSNATQSGAIKVTTSGQSDGVGLNLGGILGGGTSSSSQTAQTEDTRTRAVTANIVSSAVTNFMSRVQTRTFCETNTCSQDVSALIQLIIGRADKVVARAIEKEDGSFGLVSDAFKGTLSKEDVKLLMNTSDDSRLKFGEKATGNVTVAGVTAGGSDEKNFEGGDTRGIQWSKDSKDEWVPTSVKLYLIRASQIKQDVSVTQVAITAGPEQTGRPIPLATIAPPNDMKSATEDAVAANEQQADGDFKYLLNGPPRDLITFPLLSTPSIAAGSAYCWSAVRDSDSDYVKLKNNGGNLPPAGGTLQPATEYLRLSSVSNFIAEVGPNGECKTAANEARNLCFVSKRWMIWFKLTRAASHSLDSLLFDICGYQPIPIPGPIVFARPPGPPPRTVIPNIHEYVKYMEAIQPQ